MGVRRIWATAILLVVGASGVIDSHEGQSPDAADQLIKALRERKMQHLAARDPAEKGRYVAATMIGDSQLLLVSARYSQPALFDERLYRGDHQGAYTELNAASVRDGKLFVQDLGEPGLRPTRPAEGAFDIVYRSGGKGTSFDGNWKEQGLSKKEYQDIFELVDAQYAHALEALLSAVKGADAPLAAKP